jgi:8-oxo-dGTP pyrophosphatase MutT (NUDIX family)
MRDIVAEAQATHAEAALSREQYAPGHFTASAFVLSPTGDQLLLIYHSKLRRWLQPGGHVDTDDEDLLATAVREVAEEVGLSHLCTEAPGIFDIDIHRIPARADAPEHEHFDVRFALRSQTLRIQAGSDASACRWVTMAELRTLDSDESVLRAARKLFSE